MVEWPGKTGAGRYCWSRIEALLRNKAFFEAYRVARANFVRGVRDVLFPAGSYWLTRFGGASCEPYPASSG